jgi:hypothetical protein
MVTSHDNDDGNLDGNFKNLEEWSCEQYSLYVCMYVCNLSARNQARALDALSGYHGKNNLI